MGVNVDERSQDAVVVEVEVEAEMLRLRCRGHTAETRKLTIVGDTEKSKSERWNVCPEHLTNSQRSYRLIMST